MKSSSPRGFLAFAGPFELFSRRRILCVLWRGALLAFLCCPVLLRGGIAGSVDQSFVINFAGTVSGIASQPDGDLIMVGKFTAVNGLAPAKIARFNPDGTLHAPFTPPAMYSWEEPCFAAIQLDGKILAGVRGATPPYITRFLQDGRVDNFPPGYTQAVANPLTGALIQPDGKILVGGSNYTEPRSIGLVRFLPNGTLESTATFSIGEGPRADIGDGIISCIALQADGKIIVGGRFSRFSGQPHFGIVRLNPNGSLDPSFVARTEWGQEVACVVVQPDGKILIGGPFFTLNGQPARGIARLNPDGSTESLATFNPGTGTEGVTGIALQADGRILLSGYFLEINGQPRNRIARLLPDGNVEGTATFDAGTGADGNVTTGITLQANGKILLTGDFTSIDGQPRNQIARLNNDPASEVLTVPDNTRIKWLRGGSAPEISQTTFEVSTDGGATWSSPGTPSRIAGGWELTGLNLPDTISVRARGRFPGGDGGHSFSILEQCVDVPPLSASEAWRRQYFGTAANTGDAADLSDPDFDGNPNLAEFATGSNPFSTTPSPGLPAKNSGNLEFTWTRVKASISEANCVVEWSDSLSGTWNASSAASTTILTDDGTTQVLKTTIPAGSNGKRFARLRVTRL
ncbi:MAG TPA: delta-60 repeat domain-containing protein [Verrucomicrobiales bacterium]|nr:delta-60 repeat domain-containing protein [Verrucomicrobiales bacterium]